MKWVFTLDRLRSPFVDGRQRAEIKTSKIILKGNWFNKFCSYWIQYQQRWSCKVNMPNGPSIGVGDTFCRCVSVLCQIAFIV